MFEFVSNVSTHVPSDTATFHVIGQRHIITPYVKLPFPLHRIQNAELSIAHEMNFWLNRAWFIYVCILLPQSDDTA